MTKNIAHRGYSARYPENTMLAFEKALGTGCDGIEFDIHLSKDRRIVILHDEALDRTTDGHGYIKDYTFDGLRRLDAGQGQRIPTLEEYFDLVGSRSILTNIELKNSVFRYEGMEEMAIKAVRDRGLASQVIFSSFNHYSILKCKELAPEIRCGFLTWSWFIEAGAYTAKHGVECIHPEYNSLTEEAIREIRGNGRGINAYTVNTRQDMERLVSLGVEGIITDDPALLNEVLTVHRGGPAIR